MKGKTNVSRRRVLAGAVAGLGAVWASARGALGGGLGKKRGKKRRKNTSEAPGADKKRASEPPIWIGHL